MKRRTILCTGIKILVFTGFIISGCSKQGNITLVNKGKTEYLIYFDPTAPESVKRAAEDLKVYFGKVTGASPEILVSDKIPENHFISLGKTSAAKASGFDPDAIPNDGFRIVTADSKIFIFGPDTPDGEVNKMGGKSNGTSNGVYTFIENYLGVKWLMPGELGEYYETKKTVSIPDIDSTEISPFNYRAQPFTTSDPDWDRRMKLAKVANIKHSHGWDIIPNSLYKKHPDFFAEVDGIHVPPYRRAKLETTNPALVQAYADSIISAFRRNPNLYSFSLSPNDEGGNRWSNSKASLALTEKDPFGNVSRTPLILKFYNDVAKIVGKEFPDRKLGGYIYSCYLFPPSTGIPEIEPNLALVIATSISYGFQLYRPETQKTWDNLMEIWGENIKRDNYLYYYYDLPVSIVQPNGILYPPAPEIMNFIFSRLTKYGIMGAYIYGNPLWPASSASNYIIARLLWNPDQDAGLLLKDYYSAAYGKKAALYIEKFYSVLDTAFRSFMISHPKNNYNLTDAHLKEIYAPNYQIMEQFYLKAHKVRKDTNQQKRLELFGQVLSLTQYYLRDCGLLASDYKSLLTLSDDEVDELLTNQDKNMRITTQPGGGVENFNGIEQMPALPDAKLQQEIALPVYATQMRMLLYASDSGEVNIHVKLMDDFDGIAEFLQYSITTTDGKFIKTSALSRGKNITFKAREGGSYLMNISSRLASVKLEVTGAATAYRANFFSQGMGFTATEKYMDEPVTLYFYVPENVNNFNLTLLLEGAVADLYTPNGLAAGQLNCKTNELVSKEFNAKKSGAGFWKAVIHPFEKDHKFSGYPVIKFKLDEKLPQWIIPDPGKPLKIY